VPDQIFEKAVLVAGELDRAGIGFDMISGTSCGAMVGTCYAAGFDPGPAFSVIDERGYGDTVIRILESA